MAGAKGPQVMNDKAKKRKRDNGEADSRPKRPKSSKNKKQANGHVGPVEESKADVDVEPQASLAPSRHSDKVAANLTLQFNGDEAGWRVSKPMGGRMLDIDPILTEDEKYLILTYNTSIQIYSAADSLLIRRIPITTLDTSAPEGVLPAHIVATRLSKQTTDNVWVATSDGRIHLVNWSENAGLIKSFQTKSKTAKALAIGKANVSRTEQDIVLVIEAGQYGLDVVAYSGLGDAVPASKSLLHIQKPANGLHLLEISDCGCFLVGAVYYRLFVGRLTQQDIQALDDIQFDFLGFDTPDLVSALDLRLRKTKSSQNPKSKRLDSDDTLDILVGGARGAMYVYSDVLPRGKATGRVPFQTQKFHWHRKAVHSAKWSRDGNYVISGGSENTLVLWQLDTGKKDFLPHLSGSVENIVVSKKGSSYVVHLDDNSTMVVTTAELRPITYIAGIQSATVDPLTSKDMLVQRVSSAERDVKRPIPAAISPLDSTKLHVCCGNGRQSIMTGNVSAPLLQSFDLESFTSISRQPLARTQPTDVNITNKGHAIEEPSITHVAFSADGKWFVSADEWAPTSRDTEFLSSDERDQFVRDRHETYLKFWEVSDGAEPFALVSRVNAPHSTQWPETVLDLASDPVSTRFGTIGSDGVVRLWQPRLRQQDGIVAKGAKGQATYTWACSHVIAVGNTLDQDTVVDLSDTEAPRDPQGSIAFSEDGSTLFAAFGLADSGAVHVIDTATGVIVKTLEGLWTGELQKIRALSPFIVVLSDELRVYDVVGDELRYGIVIPQIPNVNELLQLAVDHKSGYFAVTLPVGDCSSIGVFDPAEAEPLLVCSTPHRIVSLLSAPNSSGFIALDDAAQIWVLSEGSDPDSIIAARPLQDLQLDDVSAGTNGQNPLLLNAEDADMASDNEEQDVPDDVSDVDMDDAVGPSVVPQHLLTDIFDAAPAFAAPSIEDMFYKVTGLLASAPPVTREISSGVRDPTIPSQLSFLSSAVMSFTSVPVLDLDLTKNEATKLEFLSQLRHALMEVGFLYLKNVGIPDALFQEVIAKGKAFFDLPLEEKLRIEMKNASSFLGYSRLSAEITAGEVDHREQIDLSTEHPIPAPGSLLYHNLLAPNQWPAEDSLPGFRSTYTEYIKLMSVMSINFTSLIAEAIELPPDAFNKYFDADQQHKLKIVKYPDAAELGHADAGAQSQGVGPHKDSMLTSYLLQATSHHGLQVQNIRGEWIDCPPIPGTLVVAIGQGLEALTQGVCVSTTHRVLSPAAGSGARFSIPFFQGVKLDAEFEDLETVGVGAVPEEVKAQRRRVVEQNGGRIDDVEFTFRRGGVAKTLGEATLRNRVKSHPDVGERWYPDILRSIRDEQARAKLSDVRIAGDAVEVPATAVPSH
ncbi:hypothetical protein S40288_02754 [Stachybotrys chartarum IBT 40288]|nr:hypothetical protein S40288_02754 [Stachybotrys chartarum IBT 40288]